LISATLWTLQLGKDFALRLHAGYMKLMMPRALFNGGEVTVPVGLL